MVQSADLKISQPVYNAVKINIAKPAINIPTEKQSEANGVYNAVDINIQEPEVTSKSIYSYPEANAPVTYDMANINKIPVSFPISYQTTNVILPNTTINSETESEIVDVPSEEVVEVLPEVPEPNYTTVEAEKGLPVAAMTELVFEASEPTANENIVQEEAISFKANDNNLIKQTPEIIPAEEIKPQVDLPLVVSNLTSENFDVQAQQMEEIARLSLESSQNAVPYITRDVFANLIDIIKKDTTNLEVPSDAQVSARRKMIANSIALENAKLNNTQGQVKLPYDLNDADINLAMEISPMEQAERNKEYALYTIAILSKVYTEEIEKHTGNVVPLTDIPGVSAVVDALRYNPNSGVKIAAIDALRYIQRPEYAGELTTLFTLAQADSNPEVSISATQALSTMKNN